jgi:hypothetical protein
MCLKHKEGVRFAGTVETNRERTKLRTGVVYAEVRDNKDWMFEGGYIVSQLEIILQNWYYLKLM